MNTSFSLIIAFQLLCGLKGTTVPDDIPMISLSGEAQGTTWNIKYFDQNNRNFKSAIEAVLLDFDKCLSLYRNDSELSQFNRSGSHKFVLPYFYPVLQKSKEVYQATNGAFDPTIMPLVEAYGFGPKRIGNPENANIDSLLKLVGFNHIHFDSVSIRKNIPNVRLDMNGIAQGYSVDVISSFLKNQGVNRFMVEIGGEIFCEGLKNNGKPWVTGIQHPFKSDSLLTTVQLTNRAMTTAGNYRNHFEIDGQVFSHIINPRNGSMEQNTLLSVTVFAKDAITADGYDTAFFVMGLEETKKFLGNRKDIDVYMIYTDEAGKLNTYYTDGIKNLIL